MTPPTPTLRPLTLRMHERDNVAIVANDGGLPAGTALASGLVLAERIPQGHKVALVDIAAGEAVRRYGIAIGQASEAIPAGGWVHERRLQMPAARSLEGLPIATVRPAPQRRGRRLRRVARLVDGQDPVIGAEQNGADGSLTPSPSGRGLG